MVDPADLRIREDDLTGAEVRALLRDHLAAMHEHSPVGGVHALDVDRLNAAHVTFWTAWAGDPVDRRLAGCAALAELGGDRGELKSFRTHPAYLRRGVAAALLTLVVGVARDRGYSWLGLETGSGPAFEAAHALYRSRGFEARGRFADYTDVTFSRYFELWLSTDAQR